MNPACAARLCRALASDESNRLMRMSEKEQLLDLALRVGKKAAQLLSDRPDVLEVSTKSSDVDTVSYTHLTLPTNREV